jgi:predicted site-specific integrase-resolvase
MTPADYAAKHGIPRSTVMKRLRAGTLPARQQTNGRWLILDGEATPPSDETTPDLTTLKARKLEAEIHKLQQQVSQGRDSVIEEVYDELVSEAAWLLSPLKQALGKIGLTGEQRKAVGLALRQVGQRLRRRSKIASRLTAPA